MTQPDAPARPDSFRPFLGAAVVLFMALLSIAGLKSYRDLESARNRENSLEGRIEDLRERSERLRSRIQRLRTDPGTLERLAREDLGMVRPGDIIFELPQPPTSAGAARPPRPKPMQATVPLSSPPPPSP